MSEPMIEAQSKQGPPVPRLQAGHLLGEEVEVLALAYSRGGYNLYMGADGQLPLMLLEGFQRAQPELPIEGEVARWFPPLEAIRHEQDRTYTIFVDEGALPLQGLELPCHEGTILQLLGDLVEALFTLDEQGFDLSELASWNLLYHQGRLRFVLQPLARTIDNDLPDITARLLRELLGQCLIPKVTRRLDNPLLTMSFSGDTCHQLDQFEKTADVAALRQWLQIRTSAPTPQWAIAGDTHPGLVRGHNEDALAWQLNHWQTHHRNQPRLVFAVSDGMGGHSRGEEASHLAVDCFMARYHQARREATPENPVLEETLATVFESVSHHIHEHPKLNQGISGNERPGATLVAGTVEERLLFLGNCGDSRAYLWHQGAFQQITRDHSLVQLYVDRGMLTLEEARYERSSVITSFMGIDQRTFRRDVTVTWMPPGARLLLCSDGLTDMLDDEEIAPLLEAALTPEQASETLIQAALEAGGHDNITVLLLFDQAPQADTRSKT